MDMIVGLFLCDHVQSGLVEEFGDYPDMFAGLFPDFEFKIYDCTLDEFPQDLAECDAYMCTGSRFSVYDKIPWIKTLEICLLEIRRLRIPFIGYCFGHQLLAQALGGVVKKSNLGWCIGLHPFQILQKYPWMKPSIQNMNLLMSCQDQIVALPQGATLLASSPRCKVGMYLVDHMLCVQAHPEFSKAFDRKLMAKRIDQLGASQVEAGMASLDQPLHQEAIVSWITNFIDHHVS